MAAAASERFSAAATPQEREPSTQASLSRQLDALYLLNCLSIGGSERKIVRLANQLQRRGLAPAIAYLNGPETLLPLLDPQVPRWHLDRRGKYSFAAAGRLSELIAAWQPRVVFAVNLYPALYVLGATRSMIDARPLRAALVNTTDMGSGDRWRKSIYRRLLRRFDRVVYGCEVQREQWLGHADPSLDCSRILYNGVDLEDFNPAAARDAAQSWRIAQSCTADSFVVGSVGRMIEAKNHIVLIDSVARLRYDGIDARLVLAGDGPLRAELQQRAACAGIAEAVTFTGNLADVRPILGALDVFVLPSLYIETFSNAALEAMAMRKPVILSDAGGAAEMVRDGIDGYVVPRALLAERLPALLSGLACDRSLRSRFAAAARRRVETTFSLEAMVMGYERIIEEAGNGGHR
jgi:glycosyltransferase involved in cell wall biosynthesis